VRGTDLQQFNVNLLYKLQWYRWTLLNVYVRNTAILQSMFWYWEKAANILLKLLKVQQTSFFLVLKCIVCTKQKSIQFSWTVGTVVLYIATYIWFVLWLFCNITCSPLTLPPPPCALRYRGYWRPGGRLFWRWRWEEGQRRRRWLHAAPMRKSGKRTAFQPCWICYTFAFLFIMPSCDSLLILNILLLRSILQTTVVFFYFLL